MGRGLEFRYLAITCDPNQQTGDRMQLGEEEGLLELIWHGAR